jgi:hypothetical protein
VGKDKPQGDLFLLFPSNSTTLSDVAATIRVNVDGTALARFSAQGSLIWARNAVSLLSADSIAPTFAITDNTDVALKYSWTYQSGGPVGSVTKHSIARIGAYNGNLIWKSDIDATCQYPRDIEFRSMKNDFIIVENDEFGASWQVADNNSSPVATYLDVTYSLGAAVGSDGSTLWSWGAYAGALKLNPWSAKTWSMTSNPQGGGYDVFIIGSKDDGTTIGPWFTEGDHGPYMQFVVDENGDLLIATETSGYTNFNGGQLLASVAGSVLFKVSQSDGKIIWRKELPAATGQIVLAPGNRIAVLEQGKTPGNVAPSTYVIDIYSRSNGEKLSSISAGLVNPVYGPLNNNYNGDSVVIAAGISDLFVFGGTVSAADFNPGTAVDTQGATPGVFISRYSF